MKLKLDEAGHVVVVDGKPVYVDNDGKDIPFDAPATIATIARLNGEAKTNRERYEASETKLKGFEGIDDAQAAKDALRIVGNLDAGKLVEAGKVEEIKQAAQKAAQDQLAAANKTHAAELAKVTDEKSRLENTLHSELIGGSFSRSKFITDKIAIPADLVQSRFGGSFKVENGKVVAYDSAGNQLFSKSRPGELAEFEEALELLVDAYPQKEHILKGEMKNGGGAANGGTGNTKQAGKLVGGTLQERTAAIAARFPQLSS